MSCNFSHVKPRKTKRTAELNIKAATTAEITTDINNRKFITYLP